MWCVNNAWDPNDTSWYYSSKNDAEKAIMTYIQNNSSKINRLHIYINHENNSVIYHLTNIDTNNWFDIVLFKVPLNNNIYTNWHKDFWKNRKD